MESSNNQSKRIRFSKLVDHVDVHDGDDELDFSPRTSMEHLPREIVHDILLRLPITSLVQFKSVCKSWRALAQDSHLINLHLSVNASNNDPCLILHRDSPIRSQLFFVDLATKTNEKQVQVRKIQAPFWNTNKMAEFDVVGSCNGLLCLSDTLFNDALYVYNPFTGDYTELPKSLRYNDEEVVIGFGFTEITREYKVVKIVYYRSNPGKSSKPFRSGRRISYAQSEVQVLTIGSPVWSSLGKVPYRLNKAASKALVNGRLHWVSKPCRYKPARRLVAFDLLDEQFREVPKPDCGGLNRCNFHLLVLRGNLCAAVYGNYGRLEIWMMKKYNVKESWVKEYNIGSYMPKELKKSVDRSCRTQLRWDHNLINNEPLNKRVVRVLCVLKNGEVLLEYKSRVLVCYDPKLGKFQDLVLQGLPDWFQTIAHVGSLEWIGTTIDS